MPIDIHQLQNRLNDCLRGTNPGLFDNYEAHKIVKATVREGPFSYIVLTVGIRDCCLSISDFYDLTDRLAFTVDPYFEILKIRWGYPETFDFLIPKFLELLSNNDADLPMDFLSEEIRLAGLHDVPSISALLVRRQKEGC